MLRIVALMLAVYALINVAETLILWWPNRRLMAFALMHLKKGALKEMAGITANILAAIVLFVFAVGY